ncbi:hypothetical protein DL96DRAFT_1710582 [Flagelloscypha sp. PMI_526]|nr:hypothetical protein DL96DRAFT_1710582 [Flagelloscypha sp. PMI_526]
MSSSINDLPEESFLNILTHLEEDLESLNQLSLSSRAISRPTRQFLFSHFWVTVGNDFSSFGEETLVTEFVEIMNELNCSLPYLIHKLRLHSLCQKDMPALAETLNKLHRIREFEISPDAPVDWRGLPDTLKGSLGNIVFPQLRSLIIEGAFVNLPITFLDMCPQLSHLSMDLGHSLDPDLYATFNFKPQKRYGNL